MIEVIPAILTNSPQELSELINRLEGKVDKVQIDIIDEEFAGNKTIDPSALETIDTDIKLDFHLMTKEPVDWVEKCARAFADRIIGQIELMSDQFEFVQKVQETGAKVGLALDLDTKLEKIEPTIMTDLDLILLMSVPAGFGGQKFDKIVLDKIKRLNEIRKKDSTPFKICIDGGIDKENIAKVREEGADEVSVGRSLFQGDILENIKTLKSI